MGYIEKCFVHAKCTHYTHTHTLAHVHIPGLITETWKSARVQIIAKFLGLSSGLMVVHRIYIQIVAKKKI